MSRERRQQLSIIIGNHYVLGVWIADCDLYADFVTGDTRSRIVGNGNAVLIPEEIPILYGHARAAPARTPPPAAANALP